MFKDIFITILQFIVSPQIAWREAAREQRTEQDFLHNFLYPIFGLAAAAAFVGGMWFTRNGSVAIALKQSIIVISTIYGGYYIASYLINELANRYMLSKDTFTLRRFTAYSSAVIYTLSIVMPFVSGFVILWFLAIYTVYIVNIGTERFLNVHQEMRGKFTATASIIILCSPGILYSVLSFLIK